MSEIAVPHVEAPYPFEAYPHVVEPLTEDDGGGYQITFFTRQDRRHHGKPLADWLVHLFYVRTAAESGVLGESAA